MTALSETIKCRYCGSPVIPGDTICKHCNESQKDNTEELVSLKDPTLSSYDWIIMIVSQLLGIFMALVHYIKGEKLRGIRLFKYSLILLFCKAVASYPVYYIFSTFYKILKADL